MTDVDLKPTISETNAIKLASMDEKLLNLKENMTEMKNNFKEDLNEIKAGVKELTQTIDDSYAPKAEVTEIDKRVSKIEDWQRWAIKIILGAIILAILGIIGLRSGTI